MNEIEYPICLFDEEGYPSSIALRFIEEFDCANHGRMKLVEFVREIWWMPDWGFKLKGVRKIKLELHTGGWSGNEDIIRSLRKNFIFWSLCWQKHYRGGHYYFEIK